MQDWRQSYVFETWLSQVHVTPTSGRLGQHHTNKDIELQLVSATAREVKMCLAAVMHDLCNGCY